MKTSMDQDGMKTRSVRGREEIEPASCPEKLTRKGGLLAATRSRQSSAS
jgi:hypothetical protein